MDNHTSSPSNHTSSPSNHTSFPSVLWVGDAVSATGFAKCTHAVCDHLHSIGWKVDILAINYYGSPHEYPYTIWPAYDPLDYGRDQFGVGRLPRMIDRLSPDIVVILQDPWNIQPYFNSLSAYAKSRADYNLPPIKSCPIVGWLAADAKNQKTAPDLNQLSHVVTWTQFASSELCLCGYTGQYSIVPLGVDTYIYYPRDRSEARSGLYPATMGDGLDISSAYLVGVVGRNQPRKRIDLAISYFVEWIHTYDISNAVLVLHIAPTGERGVDIPSLVRYYAKTVDPRLSSRVILREPSIGAGDPECDMPYIYSSLDLLLSTSQGEGWGLPMLEAMACGVPSIVPDWSGLGSNGGWPEPDTIVRVPCSTTAISAPISLNPHTIGGVPDRQATIEAVNREYNGQGSTSLTAMLRLSNILSWESTARGMEEVLANVLRRYNGQCQFLACNQPALCESGNYYNRRVCEEHFKLTNGTTPASTTAS